MEWKYHKKVLHILMNHFSLSLSLHGKETKERKGRRERVKEKKVIHFFEGNFLNTNEEGMK